MTRAPGHGTPAAVDTPTWRRMRRTVAWVGRGAVAAPVAALATTVAGSLGLLPGVWADAVVQMALASGVFALGWLLGVAWQTARLREVIGEVDDDGGVR